MKVIGLCGGSGSGKGTLARMLSEGGFLHIDADAVYHEITSCDSPCLRAMTEAFGRDIISPSGALDRKALASVVFADGAKDKLALLNSISHRYVLDEIRRRIALAEGKYFGAIVDAPLLFESGFASLVDRTICVVVSESLRVQRVMHRDNVTQEKVYEWISLQMPEEDKARLSDIIIHNNPCDNVFEQLTQILQALQL